MPISPRRAQLSALRYRFASAFGAVGLRAGVTDEIALPVQAGNEHGTVMVVATRLVGRNLRRLSPLRSYVSQTFAETAPAKFGRTAEELDRIIRAEGRRGHLHRPVMLVTQRQYVRPHQPSLAPDRPPAMPTNNCRCCGRLARGPQQRLQRLGSDSDQDDNLRMRRTVISWRDGKKKSQICSAPRSLSNTKCCHQLSPGFVAWLAPVRLATRVNPSITMALPSVDLSTIDLAKQKAPLARGLN